MQITVNYGGDPHNETSDGGNVASLLTPSFLSSIDAPTELSRLKIIDSDTGNQIEGNNGLYDGMEITLEVGSCTKAG